MLELFLEYVWPISFVVAIIFLAIYFGCCARKISAVGKEINRMLGHLNNAEDFNAIDEAFNKSNLLASVWKNFRGTLTQTRDGIFSSTDAAEFFSPQNFTRGMNMTFWQSYGGIFTGLGILGTFACLTAGLQGVDMTSGDIEALKKGIAKLLSTVDSAFVTSLVGIGAGLLYSGFHHKLLKDFHANVQTLANALDKKFPCKTAETWLADNLQETRDQTTILQDAEGWLSDNLQETRRQLQETQKQTTTLKNSEAQLSETFQETKKQTAILQDTEAQLAENFQEAQKQTTTLQNSQTLLEKNLQEAKNQTVSLKNIGDNVTEAILNGLDEDFGELYKKLVGFGNKLGEFNKKLDDVSDKICAAIESLSAKGSKQIDDNINRVAGAQMDRFAAALDRFSDLIDKKLQDADKLSTSMNEQLSATLEEFAGIMAQIATTLHETLNKDAKKFADERETANQKLSATVDGLLKNFTAVMEQITATAQKNSDAANTQLSSTLENLRELLNRDAKISADERETTNQKFLSTVDAVTKTLNAVAEKFKAQQETSAGNFESLVNKLLTDLKDFTEQQKEFLDIATTANTNQISEAVKTFRELVDAHNKTTQDLFTRIQNLLSATEKFLSRVNEAGNSLTQAATPVKQSSELLSQHLNTTTQAAEKFRSELAERMKNLAAENKTSSENISALTGQLVTFVQNFNGIADELERTAKIIYDSLGHYNYEISEGLRDTLTKFDKSMKDAVGYLQSLTEGLTDAIDGLKRLRNGR